MKYLKTEAFVLHRDRNDQKFSSLLLFTREIGAVYAKARGLQKIGSKLAAKLEPGQEVDVDLYEAAEGVYIITGAELISPTLPQAKDYDDMQLRFLMFEILARMLPKHEQNERIYMFFKEVLKSFRESDKLIETVLVFITRLLKLLGYVEDVKHCIQCEKSLKDTPEIYVHTFELAFYCSDCRPSHTAQKISLSALKTFSFYLDHTFDTALRLQVPEDIKKELYSLLVRSVSDIIGRPLESLQYM
ncbi:MAG: DNA repair protein RecO [Candidatus Gracilibacteria bacterium]